MRYYLAITISVLAFTSASLVRAQDCAITDCSALGYTETSNRGNCLKCPFGNAWACSVCKDSFKYPCTGTNEIGGNGSVCGGKYESCLCSEEYVWNGISCQVKVSWGKCNGSAQNCNIGDILYSDGTCASYVVSGKTPIAVVVYKSANGNCAQAMALKEIGNYHWLETSENIGDEIFDLDIKNFTSDKAASTDFQSCNNTKIIISAGDKGIYPAAWATQEYKTEGTNAGDWCLPAAGIMSSIKNNMIAINNSLVLVEGTQINTSSMYWSSSENSSSYAWTSGFSDNYGLSYYAYGFKTSNHIVRPVLEF